MEKRAVLFVDDEPNILSSLKRFLAEEPYVIFTAGSAKEALAILEHNEIHVIVADIKMPVMSGVELLEIVRERFPYVIRLVLSGSIDINNVLDAINKGVILRFITKPWGSEDELKIVILQAIEYYDLHSDREMLLGYLEKLADKNGPEEINITLIQTLLQMRKNHLYEWGQKCCSVTTIPDDNPEQETAG